MHRFFITGEQKQNTQVRLEGEQAHQIARVLRMLPGEQIIVLDNSGWEFELALDEVSEKRVIGTVLGKRLTDKEPATQLTLYQSLLKRENFEWVLQKCTEIGISHFVPILCERTVRLDHAGKLDRWGKIIREATEQSGRGLLPTISIPLSLSEALSQIKQHSLSLIAWENEKLLSLGEALARTHQFADPGTISIFIGPEGGFSEQEIETARLQGVKAVSLGKRILRAETAAVVAATIALHEFGELQSYGAPNHTS